MSLTYTTLVSSLSNLMAISSSDTNFLGILPEIIDYAELRIQRDLDFLNSVTTDTTVTTSVGTRRITAPSTFVVIEQINMITPAGTTSPDSGTRVQCVPVTKEYLDYVWNSATTTGVPTLFAMLNNWTIILGPFPDDEYTVEIVGTQREVPLSSNNATNYMSVYLPDVYLAAAMIFASGWMRNFGSQADNPQMAMSWETQYDNLLKSATVEEFRKKFAGSAWSSMSPPAIATPTR